MIWTTDYLNDLIFEAEIEINRELLCIVDRMSISVFSGIPGYLLPDFVQNIRKILWKGFRLDPMDQSEYKNWIYSIFRSGSFNPLAYNQYFDVGGALVGGRPQGRPYRYFYSTFGENMIVFNPFISEQVLMGVDNSLLWGPEIGDRVIVEFYRSPNGTTHKIPNYIRRRTIKSYVLYKAFAKEGDGQNLNASEYWKARYSRNLLRAKTILNTVNSIKTYTREPKNNFSDRLVPARPVLPSNYGITVGDEYDD